MALVYTDESHFDSSEESYNWAATSSNTSRLCSFSESYTHARNRSGMYCPWTVNLPYLDFADDNWGGEYVSGFFGPCHRITEITASIDGVDPWEWVSGEIGWRGVWTTNQAVYAPDNGGWTGGPLTTFQPWDKNYADLYPEQATSVVYASVYTYPLTFPPVRLYRYFPRCADPYTPVFSNYVTKCYLVGVGNRPAYFPYAMQRGIWQIEARCNLSGSISSLWQGGNLRLWIHNVQRWWPIDGTNPYQLGVPCPCDVIRSEADGGFGFRETPAYTGSVPETIKLDIPPTGDWVSTEFHVGWCYGGMGIESPEQHIVALTSSSPPYYESSDGECHVEIRAKLRGT